MRITLFIIFMLLMPTSNSFITAGTTDPNVPDSKYIEYGKTFKHVGKLCGTYKDKTLFCASAVAIDDHHILTAAHVVQGSTSCIFHIDDNEYCISKMVIHQDFNEKQFGSADIAIGYSEKSFNLNSYPSLYSSDDEVGKTCNISGYGFHGTFNSGAKYHDNKKRAGLNIIDGIDKDMLICSPSKPGDPKKTKLEFLIASGDSGGGLFINNELAGINSCIMAVDRSPSAKYNEESGHTRVSKFIEWINTNKTK